MRVMEQSSRRRGPAAGPHRVTRTKHFGNGGETALPQPVRNLMDNQCPAGRIGGER